MTRKATPKNEMGGRKDDAGKPRLSLIPPEAILALGEVLTHGAEKYEAHNWLRGMEHSRIMDAALRHIMDYQRGVEVDADSGMPPLWHALTDLVFLVTYEELELGEDDRRHVELGWE